MVSFADIIQLVYQVEHVLNDRLLHFVDVDLQDVKVLCVTSDKK